MRIETLKALLGEQNLPGTPEELAILGIRIEELMQRNGREWVIRRRRHLLREWATIIERAILRHS